MITQDSPVTERGIHGQTRVYGEAAVTDTHTISFEQMAAHSHEHTQLFTNPVRRHVQGACYKYTINTGARTETAGMQRGHLTIVTKRKS